MGVANQFFLFPIIMNLDSRSNITIFKVTKCTTKCTIEIIALVI